MHSDADDKWLHWVQKESVTTYFVQYVAFYYEKH